MRERELFARTKGKRDHKETLIVNSDFENFDNWKFMKIIIFHRSVSCIIYCLLIFYRMNKCFVKFNENLRRDED